MSSKLKGYLALAMSLLCAFILGMYYMVAILSIQPVEWYQWAVTAFFMIFFLLGGIIKIMEDE